MNKKFLSVGKVGFFCLFLVFYLAVNCLASEKKPLSGRSNLAKAYACYMKGILYDNNDNTKQAIREYIRAIQFDNNASDIKARLSFDYIKLGQYDNAAKQLNSALKEGGETMTIRYLLAFLYTSMQKFSDAAKEYNVILSADPKDPAALSALADLYVLQGKLKEAISIYTKLAEQKNISPLAQFNMGVLYSELDNFKAAEYSLRKATMQLERDIDKDWVKEEARLAHFYLAIIYEKHGARSSAKEQLKRAIYLDPYDPEVLNYLGYMYAEDSENLDEAIKLIKRALEAEPDNGAYLDSLGWAYFKKGELKAAFETLKKADRLMPDKEIKEHLGIVRKKIEGSKK